MYHLAVKWPFTWPQAKPLQVVSVAEAPQPDERVVLAEQIAQLRADHDFLRGELGATRRDLAAEQAHRESLQRICGRQDNELVSISTALTAARADLELSRSDKQFQSKQIHELQMQNVELKAQMALMADQLAINNGQRQGLQFAVDELKKIEAALLAENARLLAQFDKRTESERGE